MKSIDLSYIIPVYNTEEWLGECLASVAAHKGKNVEFIIVDDGSTDASPQTAEAFAAADRRARIISRPNGGLSAARNTGLEHARGRYVVFVDSDDMVDAAAMGQILDTALSEEADVAVGKVDCLGSDGSLRPWGRFLPPGVYGKGVDFLADLYRNSIYYPMAVCYMVSRKLLEEHSLYFLQGIIHEDELWTPKMLARAGKTVSTDISHYKYRIGREGSIMSSTAPFERALSLARIIRELRKDVEVMLDSASDFAKALPFYANRLAVLAEITGSLNDPGLPLDLISDFARGQAGVGVVSRKEN